VSVPVGATATFSVGATGTDPKTYQWQKGQSNIAGATAATLTIGGVQMTDEGGYRCIVTNQMGAATSNVAMLDVSAATGNIYYVDQTAGNDANNGTSPATAWKNCPGMSAHTGGKSLVAGDTVYFDRGDTWLVTGTQGLYLTGGVRYVGNTWGTGTKATIRANANLDAGVVRFRDHATVATVLEGFNVDGNGKVTNGVDINTAFWQLMNGATKRVQDCEVHHTWSRASLGQYTYGIIVSNHGGTGGYAENVEIINCVVHDTSRDAICLYPGDENKDCRIKNLLVRGCQAYEVGKDPDYGAGAGILVKGYVVDAIIENNYVRNTRGALIFVNGNETRHYGVGPTNIHIRNNILAGEIAQGAILIYENASGKDPMDLKIYGNLVFNSAGTGGLWVDNGVGNTINLRVYNNTFYNAPVAINANTATFPVLQFSNNIVFHSGSTPLVDAQGKITEHLNNIYYRTGSNVTLVSSNGANYQAGNLSSYEASASSANPLFVDPANLPTGFTGVYGGTGVDSYRPNQIGLSLQSTSYGLKHGANLGSGYAVSVNGVTRAATGPWDIGAYETPVSVTAPAAPKNLRVVPN